MSNMTVMREKLMREFSPVHFELVNESHKHRGHHHVHKHGVEGDSHFSLTMVSSVFEGMPRIQRQRLIHATLAQELADSVHALTMKLFSPKEWNERQA